MRQIFVEATKKFQLPCVVCLEQQKNLPDGTPGDIMEISCLSEEERLTLTLQMTNEGMVGDS